MNRSSSFTALAVALLLHAAAIGFLFRVSGSAEDRSSKLPSVTVELMPTQKEDQPAPTVMAAAPPVEKQRPKPKPMSEATPKPAPRAAPRVRALQDPAPARTLDPAVPVQTTADTGVPPLPNQAPTSSASDSRSAATISAQVPAPAATPAPAAPARTSVIIPAEYAATNRIPVYPAMSKRYGEQGTVVLRVLVKADGRAGIVEIRTSSGYPLLDEAAKAAVQDWRFKPATVDGKPIDDWWLVPIPFKLRD